jgi:hypothetical protein
LKSFASDNEGFHSLIVERNDAMRSKYRKRYY